MIKLGIRSLDSDDPKEQWFSLYAICSLAPARWKDEDMRRADKEAAMRALGDDDGWLVAAFVAMHRADPTLQAYIVRKLFRTASRLRRPGENRRRGFYALMREYGDRFERDSPMEVRA